tara:strand:+ start:355 stop:876 length:522 start_codon:yes stop_codon:yes gene_type:complete
MEINDPILKLNHLRQLIYPLGLKVNEKEFYKTFKLECVSKHDLSSDILSRIEIALNNKYRHRFTVPLAPDQEWTLLGSLTKYSETREKYKLKKEYANGLALRLRFANSSITQSEFKIHRAFFIRPHFGGLLRDNRLRDIRMICSDRLIQYSKTPDQQETDRKRQLINTWKNGA